MAVAAPKLVDRYLLKQLLDYFILGVVVFTLIAFFSETLLKFIREVQRYGIPFGTTLTMIGLQLPRSISLVLPASAFVAVLMVYNQLNNNFEIIAMRMNGISLWRLAVPAMALGLFCSVVAYTLNDYIVPWCTTKTEEMKQELLRRGTLPAGGTSFMFRTFDNKHNLVQMIYISHYEGRKLGDSTIIDLSKPDMMQVVQARSGKWDPRMGWEFHNANMYLVARDKDNSSAGHVEKWWMPSLMSKGENQKKIQDRIESQNDPCTITTREQSFMEIWTALQCREARGMRTSPSNYLDLWKKITWPLGCFALILAAVPLAISPPRKGDNRGFVFAIGALFLFYMVYATFQSLGKAYFIDLGGLLSQGAYLMIVSWMPLLIMLLVGVLLMQRRSQVL